MEFKTKEPIYENRLKQYFAIAIVAITAAVGAYLFLKIMLGDNQDAGSAEANAVAARPIIALCVGVAAAGVFMLSQIGKKQIVALEFDDLSKVLKVGYKPFWQNKVVLKEIAYRNLRHEIADEEVLGQEDKQVLRIYKDVQTIASLDPQHPFWLKYKRTYPKILNKLQEVQKQA